MARDSGGGFATVLWLAAFGGAGYLFYRWYQSQAVPAAAPAPIPTTTAAANSTAPQPSTPAFSQLDAVYLEMVQAAINDAKAGDTSNKLALVNGQPQTTWAAWGYFLNKVNSSLGSNLPSFQDLTGQVDLNLAITAPQYWSLMAPWLAKNKGLSGLGFYGGLGRWVWGTR